MSCELFIHSERETTIDRSEIVERMRTSGWDIVFIADLATMSPVFTGVPNVEETVFGWRCDPVLTSKFLDMLARQNNTGIERLYAEELIASCEFMKLACYEEDKIDSLFDSAEIHPDYLQTIKSAKTSYGLRLTGGTYLCYVLQAALWFAIGDTTKGLLEDPQDGSMFFYNEKSS